MRLTEDELIEGCREGNRKTQQALYDQYCKAMYVICLRYSKSELEAEDILQEAFIKVFNSIEKFQRASTLGYWIKRIVINTALNYQRSKLYLYPMVDADELKNNKAEELTLSNFHYTELLQMIQELPSGSQVIFNLYAIEGYKHHEIADMLNISEGTSKSQYARAKKLLQEKLNNQENISYGGV